MLKYKITYVKTVSIRHSVFWIQDRLLEDDCMTHGWVLTGFPNDETDLAALDSLDVAPNRLVRTKCGNKLSS